jgi:hypothetical protein
VKSLEKSVLSIAACVFLSACGQVDSLYRDVQSDAYNLGYSQASELEFKKMNNEYSAYAFCTTISKNLFLANSERELEDYINGCMEFVLTE